jgi:hypothetical protein
MPVGEDRPRSRRPEAIPLIIALVVWAIIVLLFFFPELGQSTGWDFDYWLNIGYLVIFICLLVAAVSKYTFGPASQEVEEAEDAEPVEDEEGAKAAKGTKGPKGPKAPVAKTTRPAAKTARPVAKARPASQTGAPKGVTVAPDEEPPERPPARPAAQVKAPEPAVRIVEWPFKRPGGVYSDTFVQVRRDLVLNVRTELGRVCGNCEELPACKKLVSGRITEDVFEWNFECKEGLRRELGRMRKAKLVEAAAKAKEQDAPTEPEVAEEVEPEAPGPPEPEMAAPAAYKDRKEREGKEGGAEAPPGPVEGGAGAEPSVEATVPQATATEVEPEPAADDAVGQAPPEVEETEQGGTPGPATDAEAGSGAGPEVKAKPKVKKRVKRKE